MDISKVQKQIYLSMNKDKLQYSYREKYTPNHSPQLTQDQPSNNLNWSIEDLLNKMSKVTTTYETSTNQTVSFSSDRSYFNPETNSKQNKVQLQESTDLAYSNINNLLFTLSIDFSNNNITTPKKSSYLQKLQAKLNASTPFSYTPILKQKQQRTIQNNQKIYLKPTAQQILQPQRRKIRSLFTDSAIKDVASSKIISELSQASNKIKLDIKQIKQSFIQKSPIEKGILSLNQFQIGRCVGSGKFGQVYLCRHRATGFIYALKKIFKSTIKKYNMQSQFLLQMKILYMMNHPNIIKLYGHFSDQLHFFLVMEYVEGGQLLTRLQSNEQYASQVIKQLIDAIQYIHALGIVHRDIKPENIVMSFENTAKLCDFGWAGHCKPKSMKSTYCGTLDYVSPQMKDQGKYTSKVDLWSLGVLTFELLIGNAPFRQQISNWINKGSHRQIPWSWNIIYPAQISQQAKNFINHLLKQDPDERAGIRFCKSHYFIIMHKTVKTNISIELNI